jgi:hypothetical protein
MTILRIHRLALASALSFFAFSAMAADPICTAIQEFAKSQIDTQPRSVELLTNWMPSADVLASKKCLDGGYPPGHRLCQYLLKSTAVEFPQDNLAHALKCISNVPNIGPQDVFVELFHVRYTSGSAPGIPKRVHVTLEYNSDLDGPPSLKITADRSSD